MNKLEKNPLYGEFKPRRATIYMLCSNKNEYLVKTERGHLLDLVTNDGYPVKIGLLYKRPFWFATHYDSGLSCTPNRNAKGERVKGWKSREELIEILKQIDFKRVVETNPFLDIYKNIIADSKREEESNEA